MTINSPGRPNPSVLERVLTFVYERDDPDNSGDTSRSWWALWEHNRVGLCNSGLRQYVGIPDNCRAFDAIFSTEVSNGPFFEITHDDDTGCFNLDTAEELDFYGGVTDFLSEMYEDGFYYLRVEFDSCIKRTLTSTT